MLISIDFLKLDIPCPLSTAASFCPRYKDMTCRSTKKDFSRAVRNSFQKFSSHFEFNTFTNQKSKYSSDPKSTSIGSYLLSRVPTATDPPQPESQPPHRAAHARDVKHLRSYAPMRQIGSRTAANCSTLGSFTSSAHSKSRKQSILSLETGSRLQHLVSFRMQVKAVWQ